MPPVMPTDSAAPVAALSGITRLTVSVPLPPDRFRLPPSRMLKVPAANVPLPVLLAIVAPLTVVLTVLVRLTPRRSSTEFALLRLIADVASEPPPMASVASPTLVAPA